MVKSSDTNKNQNIVVSGDMAIDWFTIRQQTAQGVGEKLNNWQISGSVESYALPGGALLLGNLVKKLLPNALIKVQSLPDGLTDIRNVPPEKIIHSQAELDFYEADIRPTFSGTSASNDIKKGTVLRVAEFHGFSGPDSGQVEFGPVADDDGKTDLLILDDAGNGYRSKRSAWPKVLENQEKPDIIYKHHRPLFAGDLFETIITYHKERTICILEANDLRRLGLNISKGLSWEKTAEDFRDTLALSTTLKNLSGMRAVIIRVGLEGAIIWLPCVNNEQEKYDDRSKLVLCYSSQMLEGGLSDRCPGKMNGAGEAFVAGLAQAWYIDGIAKPICAGTIEEVVRKAVQASICCHYLGFTKSDKKLEYVLNSNEPLIDQIKNQVCIIDIKNIQTSEDSPDEQWSIANHKMGMLLEDNAVQWVLRGDFSCLGPIPVVSFGEFISIDRYEIESFTSVCALLKEYGLKNSSEPPLSIALFGQPGSGKSYGVKQIVKSLARSFQSEILEFNLSQFNNHAKLVTAFNKIRETALRGVIPVAFFDEFDSALENAPLGWLKHFLAPMQDGTFIENDTIHHIGKSIFVFAGGTKHSFRAFSDSYTTETYRNTKAHDFISRLKGYVDVCGPNTQENKDINIVRNLEETVSAKTKPSIGNSLQARTAIMRRALILRGMLETSFKCLLDDKGTAKIDETIVRALLRVPFYTYGVRSMEALFRMSDISSSCMLGPSSLPAAHLLAIHVDADIFKQLMLYAASREVLAQKAHEIYCEKNRGKPGTPLADLYWEQLPDHYRADNRRQIDDIPERLADVRFRYIARTATSRKADEFSNDEIEYLARLEHERYVRDKLADGWRWGEKTIREEKIHASLVDWHDLPEPEKEKNRDAVRAIPELLKRAGFIMIHDYNK